MEVKPEELRVGNYIYDDFNEVHVVEKIESKKYNEWNASDPSFAVFSKLRDPYNGMYTCDVVSGVPINKSWLKNLCFREITGNWQFHKRLSALDVFARINNDRVYFEIGGIYMGEIKHVHRLQNIWHSLSNGQELLL